MDKEANAARSADPAWTEEMKAVAVAKLVTKIGEQPIYPTHDEAGDLVSGLPYRLWLVGPAMIATALNPIIGSSQSTASRTVALVDATLEALAKYELENVEYVVADEDGE